jgi:Predicted membrane protein (DUF2157)
VAYNWQSSLERWTNAGLLDLASADRIRQFEASQEKSGHLRWPTLIAIGLGALMTGAGVLLFVSAHWDTLSPTQRFVLVLLLVGIFHGAAAVIAERFSALATALHGVGTAALGAGIFLAAQIFNLQEHWPGGVLLWAIGAALAWAILRDWVQASLLAVLAPAWLACEWIDAAERFHTGEHILGRGLLLLALTYLSALYGTQRSTLRRALAWIGGVALFPSAVLAVAGSDWMTWRRGIPSSLLTIGWLVGLAVPLLIAYWLRRSDAWINVIAAAWVGVAATLPPHTVSNESLLHFAWRQVGPYIWCAVAALGLVAWGLRESRRERINLGVIGFGLTVIVFYFSEVMDKLGRSASLIGMGLLFLVLGWVLEKTRRQLVAKVRGAAA